MLKIFKDLFSEKNPVITEEEKKRRLQLAATVLMLEVSKADGEIAQVEIDKLNEILLNEFDLDDSMISVIMSDSETESADATSLHKFTKDINENCDNEERIQILSYLWKISLADNHIDSHERHFIRKIAGLLYLTDQDINSAKSIVQR